MTETYNDTLNRIYVDVLTALANGKSHHQIVGELIQQGVSPALAEEVVAKANRAKKSAFRQQGLKTFGIGVAMLILGIIITGVTYSIAKPGGVFFVTIGFFISGVVNLLRGLFRMVMG
jgi:hypothetical protein